MVDTRKTILLHCLMFTEMKNTIKTIKHVSKYIVHKRCSLNVLTAIKQNNTKLVKHHLYVKLSGNEPYSDKNN